MDLSGIILQLTCAFSIGQ